MDGMKNAHQDTLYNLSVVITVVLSSDDQYHRFCVVNVSLIPTVISPSSKRSSGLSSVLQSIGKKPKLSTLVG